jgi:hypothetical protein
MVVDGVTRPAILVRENAEPQFCEAQPGVYYVDWGEVQIAESTRPILGLDCLIWYASEGASGTGVDRGRMLAQMDEELLRICEPPHTAMRDYHMSPSTSLGGGVFWTMPEIRNVPEKTQEWSAAGARLERQAKLRVYFFLPEVEA